MLTDRLFLAQPSIASESALRVYAHPIPGALPLFPLAALNFLKSVTPAPVARVLRPAARPLVHTIARPFISKHDAELDYWRSRLEADGGTFKNAHYKRMLLAMAGETDHHFVDDRIIADFGCGPRGSLTWATSARLRIGIDVLAARYAAAFPGSITTHKMVYVTSTERTIPLPDVSIDVLFTLNAMDHVDDFPAMCRELLRILKPQGLLVASFNLNEPRSLCEPQTLTEATIDKHLLNHLTIDTRRRTARGPDNAPYEPFFTGHLIDDPAKPGYLWVRARTPGH